VKSRWFENDVMRKQAGVKEISTHMKKTPVEIWTCLQKRRWGLLLTY